MIAAANVNDDMPAYIISKAQNVLGSLESKRLAVLGLAFKAGTSDARRSPGVKLANILSKSGATVMAYDPEANGEAKEDLRRNVKVSDSLEEAIRHAAAVFVATDWPQFLTTDLAKVRSLMAGNLFVDCMNAFDILAAQKAGLHYLGVGR